MGKQSTVTPETEWGTIQLLVFPAGCEMPANKKQAAN
jgi:hypothetical protein